MRVLFLAAALFAAVPAVAQTPAASLTLVDAATAPARPVIIDGARWSCEGAACTASGAGAEQPATRACRRVVQRLGAVSAFTYKGVALTDAQIVACNA